MSAIPIENLYYLLCYAWNRLDEKDVVNVSSTNANHLLNLLARVLVSGTTHLFRRGLDRGYVKYAEVTATVKGRINFSNSIKQGLLRRCKVECEYDDFDHNVLHNKILKTTIKNLIGHPKLSIENEENLIQLYRRMHGIDEINLSARCFSRVRLHRNNSFYGFLLSICRLIYENVLAKEGSGDFQFQDFIRDPKQMARLFEEFIRNFYKMELEGKGDGCHVVGAERIEWYLDEEVPEARAYLPKMLTDISIEWPDRYLITDTKYYSQTLSRHYDKKTIHSAHLQQLFAYLMQIEPKEDKYKGCEGMLLYPVVDEEIDIEFTSRGHRVMVKTVDLSQDWKFIRNRLIEIVKS